MKPAHINNNMCVNKVLARLVGCFISQLQSIQLYASSLRSYSKHYVRMCVDPERVQANEGDRQGVWSTPQYVRQREFGVTLPTADWALGGALSRM